MNTSTLNFTVVSSPKTKFSDAQVLLREWTGKQFPRNEAESLWANIINHKWNISERLGRDVGFRVATVDFIENFYHPHKGVKPTEKLTKLKIKILSLLTQAIRFYFESKGTYPHF